MRPAIAAERYARRAGTRAAGHFDAERTPGELWHDEVARPAGGYLWDRCAEAGVVEPISLHTSHRTDVERSGSAWACFVSLPAEAQSPVRAYASMNGNSSIPL